MVTLPVDPRRVEESIGQICKRLFHDNGGQVYMDGANMNAGCRLPPGRLRAGRTAPEPAQDVQPPRRRRAGHGADLRCRTPDALPAQSPGRSWRGRRGKPLGTVSALPVGQRVDFAHPYATSP